MKQHPVIILQFITLKKKYLADALILNSINFLNSKKKKFNKKQRCTYTNNENDMSQPSI